MCEFMLLLMNLHFDVKKIIKLRKKNFDFSSWSYDNRKPPHHHFHRNIMG